MWLIIPNMALSLVMLRHVCSRIIRWQAQAFQMSLKNKTQCISYLIHPQIRQQVRTRDRGWRVESAFWSHVWPQALKVTGGWNLFNLTHLWKLNLWDETWMEQMTHVFDTSLGIFLSFGGGGERGAAGGRCRCWLMDVFLQQQQMCESSEGADSLQEFSFTLKYN